MNICIFGAGGRTGVELTRCLREKGYNVTAFVHSEKAKKWLPDDVKIIEGNILDYEDVHKAINRADAVISVIGHTKGCDPLVQTKGIQNIVKAMQAHGIRRLLSLTGTGVRIPGDRPSFVDRIANTILGIFDPKRLNDGIRHVRILQNSNLDWTVVRVLKLSNSDKALNGYKLSEGGPAELLTSRKKVAQVLIDLVDDNAYVGKAPVISG